MHEIPSWSPCLFVTSIMKVSLKPYRENTATVTVTKPAIHFIMLHRTLCLFDFDIFLCSKNSQFGTEPSVIVRKDQDVTFTGVNKQTVCHWAPYKLIWCTMCQLAGFTYSIQCLSMHADLVIGFLAIDKLAQMLNPSPEKKCLIRTFLP